MTFWERICGRFRPEPKPDFMDRAVAEERRIYEAIIESMTLLSKGLDLQGQVIEEHLRTCGKLRGVSKQLGEVHEPIGKGGKRE